ncbi:large conductance mechanosensitive channel protein MscL ['Fragaria x ananassa' phyllody phytoplasma]|uniref:Large-conductance mechanosensitive channel n=1 Tax='Fragaria x ananassa' phyllody phytoplasma TaxID=2358428 RepID=A0ABS5K2Q1_9MOLU|nr:large conductance mechanosensitive channel protein MscL ['Fragaria x ananassa' phyllody phytoplasma]MBS2126151.1 large conductance mechanosensitive channel protein MscL ['Fragaria x ananassa' phyllody phytoplasma]
MIDTHNLAEKSLKFTKGFKNFITRGNVMNLAVAVVIGQLFAKIVSSLVVDIIMPPFSLLFGYTSALKDLRFKIKGDVYLNYGNFLQNILEFVMLSFVIYSILTIFIRTSKKTSDTSKNETATILKSLKEEVTLLKEIKEILQQLPNKKQLINNKKTKKD